MPSIRLVGNLTIGIVLLYGGYRVIEGDMTVGVLAAFLLYLRMFFEPMQEISQFYNTFQSASAALEKLSGVLEEVPEVTEPTRPGAAAGGASGDDPVRPGAASRTCRTHRCCAEFDLTVPAGQTVALVGTTGRGQDDHRQADVAVLRPDRRCRPAGRGRPARAEPTPTCAGPWCW